MKGYRVRYTLFIPVGVTVPVEGSQDVFVG